jgi:phospholipase/lecithinase/hemolysin
MKTHKLLFIAASCVITARAHGQPAITRQPVSQTASLFADVSLAVSAGGVAPLRFQWAFNDTPLPGMTNRTLSITNIQRGHAGSYRVVVTNLSGSVTSQIATLTITPFNSLYAFGFSYTDTHNCGWPAPSYWEGRPSNGPMWPEYLSTNLGFAYVPSNNYARCGAFVNDTRVQVASFARPPQPALSLYCLWLTGSEVLPPEPMWEQGIIKDVQSNSNIVHRLYEKGARTVLIEGQFSDDQFPAYNDTYGTNTAYRLRYRHWSVRFNERFKEVMKSYSSSRPDLRLLFLDMQPKFEAVLANPADYGFSNADIDALEDPALSDRTFNGPGADYVFWDKWGHPTSKLHKLLAQWHLETINNSILEELELRTSGPSPTLQMNHLLIGRDYTLQYSGDLEAWRDVERFTAAAGTNQWSIAFGQDPVRFYRLTWQP